MTEPTAPKPTPPGAANTGVATGAATAGAATAGAAAAATAGAATGAAAAEITGKMTETAAMTAVAPAAAVQTSISELFVLPTAFKQPYPMPGEEVSTVRNGFVQGDNSGR